MAKTATRVIVALRAAAALMSCKTTITGSDPEAPFASWEGFEGPNDLLAAAGTSGTLRLEDGCIYLGDRIPAFPVETTWNPDTQELSLDEATIKVGEEVALQGGEADKTQLAHVPGGCERGEAGFFITTTYAQ